MGQYLDMRERERERETMRSKEKIKINLRCSEQKGEEGSIYIYVVGWKMDVELTKKNKKEREKNNASK